MAVDIFGFVKSYYGKEMCSLENGIFLKDFQHLEKFLICLEICFFKKGF